MIKMKKLQHPLKDFEKQTVKMDLRSRKKITIFFLLK